MRENLGLPISRWTLYDRWTEDSGLEVSSGQREIALSIADLDYWRYMWENNPDMIQTAQIWKDSFEKVVGFVWLNDDGADYVCQTSPLFGKLLTVRIITPSVTDTE
jgi:hypothetical protein